jgi:hypothetical protein
LAQITKPKEWKARPEGSKDRMGSTYGDEFFEFTVTNGAVINLDSSTDNHGNALPDTFDNAIIRIYDQPVRRRFGVDPTTLIGATVQAPYAEVWEGCASDIVRKMRVIATTASNALLVVEIFD